MDRSNTENESSVWGGISGWFRRQSSPPHMENETFPTLPSEIAPQYSENYQGPNDTDLFDDEAPTDLNLQQTSPVNPATSTPATAVDSGVGNSQSNRSTMNNTAPTADHGYHGDDQSETASNYELAALFQEEPEQSRVTFANNADSIHFDTGLNDSNDRTISHTQNRSNYTSAPIAPILPDRNHPQIGYQNEPLSDFQLAGEENRRSSLPFPPPSNTPILDFDQRNDSTFRPVNPTPSNTPSSFTRNMASAPSRMSTGPFTSANTPYTSTFTTTNTPYASRVRPSSTTQNRSTMLPVGTGRPVASNNRNITHDMFSQALNQRCNSTRTGDNCGWQPGPQVVSPRPSPHLDPHNQTFYEGNWFTGQPTSNLYPNEAPPSYAQSTQMPSQIRYNPPSDMPVLGHRPPHRDTPVPMYSAHRVSHAPAPPQHASMWSTNPQLSSLAPYVPSQSFPNDNRRLRTKEKEPKMFDGKRDLMDYLNYFMKLSKLNRWDYETCGLQLATSLTGDAAEVLSTLPAEQSEELQCLIRALVRRYCPKGREAQYSFDLMARSWKTGSESVIEYANELATLARKAYPDGGLPEKVMIDLFKKGLVPNMQMQVHLKQPQSMDDALAVAVAMEPFEKPRNLGAGKKPSKSDTISSVHVSPATKHKQPSKSNKSKATSNDNDSEYQEFLRWKAQKKGDKSFDGSCYYCKKRGHMIDDCLKLKAKKAREAQEAEQQQKAADQPDLN